MNARAVGWLQALWRDRPSRRAAITLAAVAAVALAAPWLAPTDRLHAHLLESFAAPSRAAPLGRAVNGVDVLAVLVWGARQALQTALAVTAITSLVGLGAGVAAALAGPRLARGALRLLDIVLAFPSILVAMDVAFVLPPSSLSTVLALSITGWATVARVARAETLRVGALDHCAAARALGASAAQVAVRHVLPFLWAPIAVQATFGFGGVIVAQSALAFLGIGTRPEVPTWGGLLDDGLGCLLTAPHVALSAAAAIAAVAIASQVLGDGLVRVGQARVR